jgi:hypothetical protein
MGKIISLCLISIFVGVSCKKDMLEDSPENALTGRWTWGYSTHTHGLCESPVWTDTLSQQTILTYHVVDFREKGKVIFYEDNKVTKKRIVFSSKNATGNYGLEFEIKLDNNPDDILKGGINNDGYVLWLNYPFTAEVEGCDAYVNYFFRETY